MNWVWVGHGLFVLSPLETETPPVGWQDLGPDQRHMKDLFQRRPGQGLDCDVRFVRIYGAPQGYGFTKVKRT